MPSTTAATKSTMPSTALPKVPLGLDETPERGLQRAEAYALGTACTLAGREMSSMPFGGGRIGSRIDEAVKLEPKNPRVRLVEALVAFERAGKDATEKAAAVQKLRAVTTMFEAARAGASTTPEWGAAEAYAFPRSSPVRPARRRRRARGAGAGAADRAGLWLRCVDLMAQITR